MEASTETMEAKKIDLWSNVMHKIALSVIFLGISNAIFCHTPAFNLLNNQINSVFLNEQVPPEYFIDFQRYTYMIIGSVTIAWGIVMAWIAKTAFKNQEKWAWNALFGGLVSWFGVFVVASIWYGVYVVLIMNSFVFFALLVPLILSRKYFFV